MKLKKLEVRNFAGITAADMDLSMPVNLLVGENNQGKSSIRDAIGFVLTGLCPSRGFNTKVSAPGLTNRNGNGKLAVSLTTDKGVYAQTAKSSMKGPVDPIVARIITDPQSVLTMKPEDRQKVFGTILQSDDTAEKIQAYLNDQAVSFGEDVLEQAEAGDLDALQAWAVEQRRIAKRDLKDLAEASSQSPASVVEIQGKMVDLTTMTMPDIEQKLALRNAEQAKLKAIMAEVENEDGELIPVPADYPKLKAESEAALAELQQTDWTAAVAKAAGEVDDCEHDLRTSHTSLANSEGLLIGIDASIKDLKESDGICPTCGQKIDMAQVQAKLAALETEQHSLEAAIAEAKEMVESYQRGLQDARKTHQDAVESQKSAGAAIQDHQDTIAQINQLTASVEQYPKWQAQVADLAGKIENLRALHTAKGTYQAWQTANGNIQEKIATAQDRRDEMDRLDGILKPDGDLRQLANADVESAQMDTDLQAKWGLESLSLMADGTVWLHGDPVEAASTSEKYRAGVLLAELLSRSLNVGILCLDGLEILSQSNRRILFRHLPNWLGTHPSTILLMTAPKAALAGLPKTNWLRSWWVENGTVTMVQKEQVA